VPVIEIEIILGSSKKARSVQLRQERFSIGKRGTLAVPVPWLQDDHLVVDNSDDLVRVRCGPKAQAILNGQELTQDWAILPPNGVAQISGPGGRSLVLHFRYNAAARGGVLLKEGPAPESQESFPVQKATLSPLDQTGWLAKTSGAQNDFLPADAGPASLQPPTKKRNYLPHVAIALLFLILAGATTASLVNKHIRSAENQRIADDKQWVYDHLDQAHKLLDRKEYSNAKAALDAAESVAEKYPDMKIELDQIASYRQSDEIKLGSNGYVLWEGKWLTGESATALKLWAEQNNPKIELLMQKAGGACKAGDFVASRLACEEALALMDTYPLKPHPKDKSVRDLLCDAKNEEERAEMTAKGLVLYDRKWMTPQEKFRLEQQSKGLVEHKGLWMSKDDAFAAEQTEKGLVLFNGKWITPDQKKEAQGFVKFEGKWVKPEEKEKMLAQRTEAEEAQKLRLAEVEKKKQQKQEQEQQDALAIEKLKMAAYAKSQEYCMKKLSAPASAVFPPYESNEVLVKFKEGWYLVKAVVDSHDTRGVMLRKTYFSKLRPTPGKPGNWDVETTFFD
jgi:hypothetical protein